MFHHQMVHHVKCHVLQNHLISSGIRLNALPEREEWITKVQVNLKIEQRGEIYLYDIIIYMIELLFFLFWKFKFDVSTRPRARSPYLKRIVSVPSESAQLRPRDDSMGVQFALITAFDTKNIY